MLIYHFFPSKLCTLLEACKEKAAASLTGSFSSLRWLAFFLPACLQKPLFSKSNNLTSSQLRVNHCTTFHFFPGTQWPLKGNSFSLFQKIFLLLFLQIHFLANFFLWGWLFYFTDINCLYGASLVAQWLRIHLPTQGTWVRALVWEDATCRGAIKPTHLEPSSPYSPQLEKDRVQQRRPNAAKKKWPLCRTTLRMI